ncbi:MAG TPA: indole-3-glycerol phosphate synthase TrpC [Saprospiraceae bacterium]|nr:indole-3-glycerol phosphate synthase TrpC [Saprospiraceae bacterium]
MNILSKIVAHKKVEIQTRKELYPTKLLESTEFFSSPTLSMAGYIKRDDKSGIIAEFKKKSPSKPSINLFADVKNVTLGYMQAGASALSVLTDEVFFGGKSADLTKARLYNYCPIIRKDFIIDEYQIIEARSIGADAILLITEILSIEEVKKLASFANSLGLEVLLELHSEIQLAKYCPECQLIGVNNRNLETFVTSLDFSKNLIDKLPQEAVKISESGISSPAEAKELKAVGYDGFLIGEQFMKSHDPGTAANEFINALIN